MDSSQRALHALTISLEEYGVVLKPGRIMSTADITHVQQGFRVPIPVLEKGVESEVPVMTLCERYLKFGDPFRKVCKSVGKVRDWLRATVDSLMRIQKRIIQQAMESLPLDDRQWVVGDRRQTEWDTGRDNPVRDLEGSSTPRTKRSEPELHDVHYHIFGLAGAGDVDYNRQLIKVLQESAGETNQNMLELANRTEQALGMMTDVTNHLAGMEQYLKQLHEWIVSHFNQMEITDDALQTFDYCL